MTYEIWMGNVVVEKCFTRKEAERRIQQLKARCIGSRIGISLIVR